MSVYITTSWYRMRSAHLLGQSLHLLRLQTGVREHADLSGVSKCYGNYRVTKASYLAGDVGPVVLAAQLLQVLLQQGTHLDDAVSHALDLTQPLLVQLRVVQDGGRDAGTVDGRVGVERTDEDLDLRVHALLLLCVLADKGESADTLTVQTLFKSVYLCSSMSSAKDNTDHVLGKALAESNVVALLDKVSRGKRIAVRVTAGKALVGHVEEGKVLLLLHDVADLAPLRLGRVDTGRVVRTGVQQDDALVRGGLEVRDQALKVQANGVLVVVAVLRDLEAGVLEDGIVVRPAGGGDIDLLRVRVEAREERTTDAQGAGAGDGLGNGETVLLDGGGVGAVGQLGRSLGEGGDTGDAGVLLVEAGGNNLVLGGADGRQDVRLALVVTCADGRCQYCSEQGKKKTADNAGRHTVSSHAQVDLLLERVGLESFSDTQDGVLAVLSVSNGCRLHLTVLSRAHRRTLGDIGPGRRRSDARDQDAEA